MGFPRDVLDIYFTPKTGPERPERPIFFYVFDCETAQESSTFQIKCRGDCLRVICSVGGFPATPSPSLSDPPTGPALVCPEGHVTAAQHRLLLSTACPSSAGLLYCPHCQAPIRSPFGLARPSLMEPKRGDCFWVFSSSVFFSTFLIRDSRPISVPMITLRIFAMDGPQYVGSGTGCAPPAPTPLASRSPSGRRSAPHSRSTRGPPPPRATLHRLSATLRSSPVCLSCPPQGPWLARLACLQTRVGWPGRSDDVALECDVSSIPCLISSWVGCWQQIPHGRMAGENER